MVLMAHLATPKETFREGRNIDAWGQFYGIYEDGSLWLAHAA
jgi:hypothetical protein